MQHLGNGKKSGRRKSSLRFGNRYPFRSDAERHFVQNYEDGDYVQINKSWKGIPRRGTTVRITGRDESKGLLFAKSFKPFIVTSDETGISQTAESALLERPCDLRHMYTIDVQAYTAWT